jgi:NLPA lipoprotein
VTWTDLRPLLERACRDTLHMVGWSTLIAVGGGLPINFLAVKKGAENDPRVAKPAKLFTSAEVRKFIEGKYDGSVIPSF